MVNRLFPELLKQARTTRQPGRTTCLREASGPQTCFAGSPRAAVPLTFSGLFAERETLGAVTIGVSCVPSSQITQEAAIAIEVITGPEIITGSTRMKAGTATKLVLNMLTTGAMIRLGYVYGNLMVNVQPRNEKLRDRARRIVRDAAGVDEARAAELLDASGGSVRTAIVMAVRGLSRPDAQSLLERHAGVVGQALSSKEI